MKEMNKKEKIDTFLHLLEERYESFEILRSSDVDVIIYPENDADFIANPLCIFEVADALTLNSYIYVEKKDNRPAIMIF